MLMHESCTIFNSCSFQSIFALFENFASKINVMKTKLSIWLWEWKTWWMTYFSWNLPFYAVPRSTLVYSKNSTKPSLRTTITRKLFLNILGQLLHWKKRKNWLVQTLTDSTAELLIIGAWICFFILYPCIMQQTITEKLSHLVIAFISSTNKTQKNIKSYRYMYDYT